MRLSVMDRKALTRAFALEYRNARRLRKTAILNEFLQLTGYNRSYATRALRSILRPKPVRKKYSRAPAYGPDVRTALEKIWLLMDCICGQRLVPILPDLIDSLEAHGEIDMLSAEVREQLKSISSATIDRLLEGARKKRGRKKYHHTKPGTFLRSQIPIRMYGEWPEKRPGYCELDLVGHEGGDNSGDFYYTLTVTDIHTGWTTLQLLPTKGQVDTLAGLDRVRNLLPFPLRGIDCDNGSEFMNQHFVDYCREKEIKFTRCRPYKKNDNCFVEQKNYSVVRRSVGYLRYDQSREAVLIQKLYGCLHLYVNFFQPSKKMIYKIREGSKQTRKYDTPQTPFQRLLSAGGLSPAKKRALLHKLKSLNPAELKRSIDECQAALIDLGKRKPATRSRYLDKSDLSYLRRHKKRSKPAKKSPSTFSEQQNLQRLRDTIEGVASKRRKTN